MSIVKLFTLTNLVVGKHVPSKGQYHSVFEMRYLLFDVMSTDSQLPHFQMGDQPAMLVATSLTAV